MWRGIRLLANEQLSGVSAVVKDPFDVVMIKEKRVIDKRAIAAAAAAAASALEGKGDGGDSATDDVSSGSLVDRQCCCSAALLHCAHTLCCAVWACYV